MPLIGTRGGASSRGFGRFGGAGALYAFTSHTFTTNNNTGRTGPSVSSLAAAYSSSGATWASNTEFYTEGAFNGYQKWTVPETATYQFTVNGAGGSGQYLGRSIRFNYPLISGTKLQLIVGQRPGNGSSGFGGGGGASWVINEGGTFLYAAAGAGAGGYDYSGGDANTSTSGNQGSPDGSSPANGGSGGEGGGRTTVGSNGNGGSGAGWLSDGGGGEGQINGIAKGVSYANGFTGGYGTQGSWASSAFEGGFGGGGAAWANSDGNTTYVRCGGGAGYSGGGGGSFNGTASGNSGGGGGSYIDPNAQSVNLAYGTVPAGTNGTIQVVKL